MNVPKLAPSPIRYLLVIISIIGLLTAGSGAAASVSCSLPAILFSIAALGFAGIVLFYILSV